VVVAASPQRLTRHLYAWGLLTFLLAAFTAHQILVPAPHTAQFGVGTAAEQWGKHDSKDFAQQLVLAPQASFDLGDQVVAEAQVLERLLQGLGGLLCLAAVALEAFSGSVTPALYRFRLSFMILSGTAHGVLLHLLG